MDKALNIAHCVESYFPAAGGMAEVVRQLSERMTAAGHRVTVYTSAHQQRNYPERNGVHIKSFALSGNAVSGIKGPVTKYVKEIGEGKYDLVVLFAAQQAFSDALLPHLDKIHSRLVFVPTGFSHLYTPAWKNYYAEMKAHLKKFHALVFHSETYRDAQFARKAGLKNIHIIPNAAAREEFENPSAIDLRKELGLQATERLVLHVGSFTGIKGHYEALKIFARARLKNTTLILAGGNFAPLHKLLRAHPRYMWLLLKLKLQGQRFITVEWERSRVVAAFFQSDVFLFPSLIECSPIVLFECMAAGLPFISSAAGNAAEIATWSNAGMVIPGTETANGYQHIHIDSGAQQLQQMMRELPEWKQRALRGREAWLRHYTWELIAERYLLLYKNLLNQEPQLT